MKDPDPATRCSAMITITTLGLAAIQPADAAKALLDDPATACDAADALGRMGPAVQPIPEAMVQMLSSKQVQPQWAAVRAMSQIGGKEAHPAVEYMIAKFNAGTTEAEGYNMHIYLSMLGAEAADALPTLQNIGIKNPVLPSSTRWAIQCDQYLPWNSSGMGGMGAHGGGVDISKVIYEAYVINLGERLRPATKLMAAKLMDGTAGTVPDYGYKLLACAPDEALKILTPHLADDTSQMRERAAVGLGYMGPAAAPAKEQLTAALAKATDDRENRLISWALRQLDREDD